MIEKICQTCAMWNSLDCLIKLPDFGCEKWHRNKLTNGDRIRQMTDEELRDFLDGFLCDQVGACRAGDMNCDECCLKWLKQEAKEDADA